MKSWKTTLGGILSGGGLAFAQFFPQWSKWGMFASALGSVLLGIAARDNSVTSEQAGALDHPKTPLVLPALAGLCAIMLLPGCQTQNAAGRILASTVQTVDAAMQAWGTYVALGHAKPGEEETVRLAYAQYQSAEAIAERAYVLAAKSGDQSAFTLAADTLRSTQADLLALLNTFNPPP